VAAFQRSVTVHDDESSGLSFYDYGPLALRGRWPQEHLDRWQQLKQIVKHEARFLGRRHGRSSTRFSVVWMASAVA
jgi:hypothetical protein